MTKQEWKYCLIFALLSILWMFTMAVNIYVQNIRLESLEEQMCEVCDD
jgi:hypothetical protein